MAAKPDTTRSRSGDAASSYGELRTLLQERLAGFSSGQQRIARLLLSDPEGCAFRTIGETARIAQVHESSVVRFATALGLDGYPGLLELCRQQISDQAQLLRRFDEAQRHADPEDLLTATAAHDQRNLARTYALIDHASWQRAVKLLTKASAVHVIGLRKCFAVAYLLTYLLHLVRRNVQQLTSASGLLVDQLRDVRASDVLVAISIHRYTADTLRVLAFAHERGLRTIVLTDNAASPLVPYADVVFYVETSGVTILRSITAFNSLVQALATAVAVELGTQSRSELLLDEELHLAFHAFVDEAALPATSSEDRTPPEAARTPPRARSRAQSRHAKTSMDDLD